MRQLLLELQEFLLKLGQLLLVSPSVEFLFAHLSPHLFLQLLTFIRALAKSVLQSIPVFDETLDVRLEVTHFAFELCVHTEHIHLVVLLGLHPYMRLL